MFFNEVFENVNIDEDILKTYELSKYLFFDIETTGFNREEHKIILISIGKLLKGKMKIMQFFADNEEEERLLLEKVSPYFNKSLYWCSYNGIAFDEPFLRKRFEIYNLLLNKPEEHFDLFRKIKPFSKALGLIRCNLKTVEGYVNIKRKDLIDGGQSVELYNEYILNKSEAIRKRILLHNYEDVKNLPEIFKVIYEINMRDDIKREDMASEKQQRYIKSLTNKNGLNINFNYEKISKKAASQIIKKLILKCDEKEIEFILNNYY